MPHRRVGALTGTVAAGAPRRSSPRTHRRPGGSHILRTRTRGQRMPRRDERWCGEVARRPHGAGMSRAGRAALWVGRRRAAAALSRRPDLLNPGVGRVAAEGAEDCSKTRSWSLRAREASEWRPPRDGRRVVTGPPELAASARGRRRFRLRAPQRAARIWSRLRRGRDRPPCSPGGGRS